MNPEPGQGNNCFDYLKEPFEKKNFKAIQKAYGLLNVKNLYISEKLKLSVELFLVQNQYTNNEVYGSTQECDNETRIKSLNNFFLELKTQRVDDNDFTELLFLLQLQIILKNLSLIQSTNVSFFKDLPWIEIEFLISLYICIQEKSEPHFIISKMVIHRTELISFIGLFIDELNGLKNLKQSIHNFKKILQKYDKFELLSMYKENGIDSINGAIKIEANNKTSDNKGSNKITRLLNPKNNQYTNNGLYKNTKECENGRQIQLVNNMYLKLKKNMADTQGNDFIDLLLLKTIQEKFHLIDSINFYEDLPWFEIDFQIRSYIFVKENFELHTEMSQDLVSIIDEFLDALNKLQKIKTKFKKMNKKYDNLKTHFSLHRMLYYINACDTDNITYDSNIKGHITQRILQIVGEHVKSYPKNYNISTKTSNILNKIAPKYFVRFAIDLRNMLSHVMTENETQTNVKYFEHINLDLRKIINPFSKCLYNERTCALSVFSSKFLKIVDLKPLLRILSSQDIEIGYKMFCECKEPQEFNKRWNSFCQKYSGQLSIEKDLEKIRKYQLELESIETKFVCDYMNLPVANIFEQNNKIEKRFLSYLLCFTSKYKLVNDLPLTHCEILKNVNKLKTSIIIDSNGKKILNEMEKELTSSTVFMNAISQLKFRMQNISSLNTIKEIENIFNFFLTRFKSNKNNSDIISSEKLEQFIEKEKNIYQGKVELVKYIRENDSSNLDEIKELGLRYGISIGNIPNEKASAYSFISRINCPYETTVKCCRQYKKNSSKFKSYKEKITNFFYCATNAKNCENSKTFVDEILKDFIDDIHTKRLNELKKKLETLFPECVTQKIPVVKEFECFKRNPKLQLVTEMILLQLCDILFKEEKSSISFLDDHCPIVTGRNLRNYLAHGNLLIDALTVNTQRTIFLNAIAFAIMDPDDFRNIKNNGNKNILKVDICRIEQENIDSVKNQIEIFWKASKGDLCLIKECISKSAEINGHDINGRDILFYISKNNPYNFITFILNRIEGNDSQNSNQTVLNFILTENNFNCAHYKSQNLKRFNNQCYHSIWQEIMQDDKLNKIEIIIFLLDFAVQNDCRVLYNRILSQIKIEADFLRKLISRIIVNPIQKGKIETVEFFLTYCSIDGKYEDDFRGLHDAVIYNQLQCVTLLCNNKVDVNGIVGEKTPLHLAIQYGYTNIVTELMKYNANVNIKDRSTDLTPLMMAILWNQSDIVSVLLENEANFHATYGKNQNVLHLAIEVKNLELFKDFVKLSVDINAFSDGGLNILSFAAAISSIDILKYLLSDIKIDANAKTHTTALHSACEEGNMKAVKLLLSYGANLNIKNSEGFVPLELAVRNGHSKIVKALINQKPDLKLNGSVYEAINGNNLKLFKYLVGKGQDTLQNMKDVLIYAIHRKQLKIIEFLWKFYPIPELKNGEETYLHAAAKEDSKDILQLLLNKKLNVNAIDKKGFTPLFPAVENDNLEIVELLISHKADVNHQDKYGSTCLHSAVYLKLHYIVDILLRNGANMNLKDSFGCTPLDFAIRYADHDICNTLIEFGADINL